MAFDLRVTALVLAVAAMPTLAEARDRSVARDDQRGGRGHVTRSDIQDQFDAYAIVQAQDALKLSDEQYPQFVRCARALHGTRRRLQAQRERLLMQIAQHLRARQADEGRLESLTRDLDAHDRKALDAIQKAYDDVDQILSVRQRAQFRVLEQQLERKKLDMLMRARQRR